MKLTQNSFRASALVVATVLLSAINSIAQQNPLIRCATVEMDSILHAQNPNLPTNQEFEEWISKKISNKKKLAETSLIINGVYQIPVVVHIVHDGDAIGTGDNLSAAIIQSQIDVLNEDFRKLFGTPGYNTHVVGADTKIEFCLAKRRPDGTAFPAGDDGINRVDRNATPWGIGAPPYTTAEINATIKPWSTGTDLGGWNPADYMNFWVMDISGGILGYAQFPTSAVGGMGCGTQSIATDGVVMLTSSIGKSTVTGFPGPYNEGRTATHEIGHWLGLRHIWGDGGCGVDDFCADTPLSDGSNFGCATTNSCTDNYGAPWPVADPNDMVENYMDYSDDDCMNIFTYDQMTRMRTVLETSPIRASLITSDACIPPAVSDASIVGILNPLGDNCPGSITPSVTIKNRGSSTLTSATIYYTINNGNPVSFSWTGSVASGATGGTALPAFTPLLGINTIKAYSELPNGVTDPDPIFDTTSLQFAVSNGIQPDHVEDFEAGQFPPDIRWLIDNPNGDCMSWIGQSGVSSTGVDPNDAACAPFYNNNGSTQEEYLYTPIFILPCNAASAEVVFDHAYRRRVNASSDRLRLQMSLDCGVTWTNTLFDQQGNALSTGGNSNSYWIPTVAVDWDNNVIDLSAFVTGVSQNIQFRFRATNAAGNSGGNIHVDNFEFNAVTPGEIELDVAGTNVLDEGFYDYGTIGVGSTTTAAFTISNPGTSNLVLTGPIVVTGNPEFTLNTAFGTTTVPAGGSTTFTVDFNPVTPGVYTGSVAFGTNDCDEGTYNFILNGTTNVDPPTASFTAVPTTICQGGTVAYTDASSNASTWTWSFPNGTPNSATGSGPHVITYNTAGGPYDAQLDVTNAFGSDTDLQSSLVTVIPSTGTTLPISEGFEGGVAPTNWIIVNGGQGATWEQNTPGTAPTSTNSVSIDNFNAPNPSGDVDDLIVEKFDLTGYVSSLLTFDVAYARYNGTFFDQLDVLVSTDCGGSYTNVYSEAGALLATDADQTTAYAANTWRNEIIDLSPFVGSSSVEVVFRNTSGYGQFLYLDNVNITGVVSACDNPDVPTMTYTPATVCDGGDATISITGNLDDATDWYVYTGSCGGTAVGTTNTSTIVVTPTGPSTTYYIRGEGGCVIPGSCGNINVTVDPIEDATFAYGAAAYCIDGSDPTPTASGAGSGTYTSAPAGLSINASTGVIDVSAATPNTYTVTYTTPGTCTGVSNEVVTINALPAAPTVLTSGSTTFCAGGSVDLTSSQASGNVWSNTAMTQTINVTGAGNYSVTYTDGNGCSATSAITAVTVNANPAVPTISADGPTSFCMGGSVNLTSSQASGNVWSNTATTQTIGVSGSGNFSVTYTDGNGCSSTSAITAVTLNANPGAPTISAGGPTTFCAGGSVNLTSSQASGNVWSTTETTQTINAAATGNYSVTYTDGNGCSAISAITAVTVNTNPSAPTISAGGPTTFCAGGSVTLTSSQGSGNVWSTASTSNNIIVSTGGPYSVTYTDVNGCSATSGVTNVTVNPAPVIAVGTVLDPSACATAAGSIQITGSGTGVVSWTGTATGNSGSVSLPYTITGLAAGSYNVTFDDGCGSNNLNQTLTDPTPPATPTITAGGPTTFCTGASVALTSSYGTGNTWSTAETTSMINVTSTGTYSVTYTDGSGCSSSSAPISITVNANPAIPTVSPDGPTTFCSGGSVNLSSSQSTGNVWSNAATSQVINVTIAGPYSVTYTDGNGCSSASVVTNITVNATPSAPVISAGGPLTFCAGGSVDLTSSQGTGNVWSTAETAQMITATVTGAYSVVYTAGNGCSATSAITNVSVNPIPVITIGGVTNPTGCATTTGSIQVSGSGTGVVNWTGTASGTSGSVSLPYAITGLGAGPYSVTFDQLGCTSVAIAPTLVDPTPPAVPNVVASGATTFCTGGSVDLTSSYAAGNDWSNTETTQSITVISTGVYSVTYIDGSGCSSTSALISVTVNPNPVAPIVTASGPITFCDGGSVDLTSGQATGIVWSSTETTATINLTASGAFDVTYTDVNGCFATSTQTIVTVNPIPSAPIIMASGPTTFCDGGSVDLSSDQVTGNDWSTTETTQTITVSTAGPYSVTYTDGNGCVATSASIDVVVNALPTVTMTALPDVCNYTAAFSLSGGSPAGGTYSGAGVIGGSFDPSIAGDGAHTITYHYTDGNGCSGSASQDIFVDGCQDLQEIKNADVIVYPNPTSTLINVYTQGALISNVKVYDGAGRLISEYKETSEKIAIDLSQVARGVYHLEIAIGDQTYRSRVVKR